MKIQPLPAPPRPSLAAPDAYAITLTQAEAETLKALAGSIGSQEAEYLLGTDKGQGWAVHLLSVDLFFALVATGV